MPGPAVHHIIANEYLLKILKAKYTDSQSTAFWNSMDVGDKAPYFYLGAQGPDFLFFNMRDWPLGGTIKTIAETCSDVQEFIEDLRKKVKEMIPDEIWAAIDELEELADDAVERSTVLSTIADLSNDVKLNINAIKALIEGKLKDYVTDSYDLFNMIKHPQQHGQKFPDWWWFDTLHIRRSGRFLTELMNQSANYSPERAYALGYLTHYAADTVGHAYVNAISGGPYRTHSQRHKVVENHQDVWAYSNFPGGEFVKSRLAEKYVINNESDKLPRNLKNYLISCIRKVYYDNTGTQTLYGKGIAEDDLDIAYKYWLKWFSGSTNDIGLPLPQPYSLTDEIAEAWNRFLGTAGDIGEYIEDSTSGGGGLIGFLKALVALIVGPILLAIALIDFIIGAIATLGAAPLRFFLSLCYEGLYNSYQNLRNGLAMTGFAFPFKGQLNNHIVLHMLNSKICDVYGHNSMSLPSINAYPASKFSMTGLEPEAHLMYPWPSAEFAEPDSCTGFPEKYFSASPACFMNGSEVVFDPSQFDYYKKFIESGSSGATQVSINDKFTAFASMALKDGLGNALDFSDALYAEYLSLGSAYSFTDFNLDSDRGYAYKSWRKVKDMTLLNSPSIDTAKINVPIESDRKAPNAQTDIIYPERSAL